MQLAIAETMNRPPQNSTRRRPLGRFERQHREKALLELLQKYPNQVMIGLASQQEANWTYGRLYLVGAIDKDQYEAAKHLDRVTRDYEVLVHKHGLVKASSYGSSSGATPEDLSKSAQKKFKKVQKKYDEVYALLDQCGKDVKAAILFTLKEDDIDNLEELKIGLTVLATAFIIVEGREAKK